MPRLVTRSRLRSHLFAQALEKRLAPAAFVVDALTDTGTGSSNTGDFRYCITQANLVNDPDTITFGVTGKISLGSTLTITQPLTITGPGIGLMNIDGKSASRIFMIQTAEPVVIAGIKLTNGATFTAGGAIRLDTAAGNLSLTGCELSNNSSSIGSPGGAMFVSAGSTLTIDQCTISGNFGQRGGGIYFYNGGNISIINTTISGNTASGSNNGGGGIYFYGLPSAFVMRNTTVSGNSTAGRGGALSLYFASGDFDITNSTITKNTAALGGGGIATNNANPVLQLESTIVAQNSHASSPDILHTGTTEAMKCLIGVSDGMTDLDPTDSIVGNLGAPANAKLLALDDNGGPTLTHLPAPDSPVRNNGSNPAGLKIDQRGEMREIDLTADIGSVESLASNPSATFIAIAPIVFPGATPNTIQVIFSDGVAIDVSTITTDAVKILDPVGKMVSITEVKVDNPMDGPVRTATFTFDPPGGAWDPNDSGFYSVNIVADQVFDTDGPNAVPAGNIGTFVVSMSNTWVVNAVNDEAVDTDGKLSLREAILRSNAPGSSDTITFDKTTFFSSQTIMLALGDFVLSDAVSIQGPSAPLTINAQVKSRHFTIDAANSGSIFSLSKLTLINGRRSGTNPADRGGSIRLADETLTITQCRLTNNSAEACGGAIYTDSNLTKLFIFESVIDQNVSYGKPGLNSGTGGGIAIGKDSETSIARTTVSGNTANGAGGGIHFYLGGTLSLIDSTVSGNVALGVDTGGGGIYFYGAAGAGGFRITNSTLSGNTAVNGPGGALSTFFKGGIIDISNSTIVENVAKAGGAALTRFGGTATGDTFKLNSTIVAKNHHNDVALTPFDISLSSPGMIDGHSNLIGVAGVGNFMLTQLDNQKGTQGSPLDPKLEPLGENGGPTKTHLPMAKSPVLDNGNNDLNLEFDQRGNPSGRGFGNADVGSVELQPPPFEIATIVVNDGEVQRSRVTSITVTFNQVVNFANAVVDAFELNRQVTGESINLAAVFGNTGGFTTVRLTFIGGFVDGSSLKDGRYTLRIKASEFDAPGFDGNHDGLISGSPIDDHVVVGSPTSPEKLFRLFGDADGSGNVDFFIDLFALRLAFGAPSSIFDFNESGSTDFSDFFQFRTRIGSSV